LERLISEQSRTALGCLAGKGAAASTLTVAEELLARSAAAGLGPAEHATLRSAVASGELGVAGQLLMGAFVGASGSTSDGAAPEGGLTCAVCSEAICSDSDPFAVARGAVGCLNGHALHAACAADVALGGGTCPTCRAHLHHAQLPEAEADAARRAVAVQEKEDENLGRERTFMVGDCVRVHASRLECMLLQSHPHCGGWHEDMAAACGTEGTVANIVADPEMANRRGADVRPRPVEVCGADGSMWRWHPGALKLVRASSKDEAAAAKESAQQLARLRAELAEVKLARENLKGKSEGPQGATPSTPLCATKAVVGDSAEASMARSGGSMDTMHNAPRAVPIDKLREQHLLELMSEWGDDNAACRARAKLQDELRAGNIDSVARAVRRTNAVANVLHAAWADAVKPTSRYRVAPGVRIQFLARPYRGAPYTGHALAPGADFTSLREVLDAEGNLWLRVNSVAKVAARVGITGGTEAGSTPTAADSDSDTAPQPVPLPDIVPVMPPHPLLPGVPPLPHMRPSTAGQPVLTQGWVQMRPGGLGSRRVVAPVCTSLRCSSCKGDLVPPFAQRSSGPSGHWTPMAAIEEAHVNPGDIVLVAATLERVIVVRKLSQLVGRNVTHLVLCRFLGCSNGETFGDEDDENEDIFAFRLEELVWPRSPPPPAASTSGTIIDDEELRLFQGALRSRREVFLALGGDEARAREHWGDCNATALLGNIDAATTFASCLRGHLIHARCFQGRLIAGLGCPVCPEPFFFPTVQHTSQNEGSEDGQGECCGAAAASDVAVGTALSAAEEVEAAARLRAVQGSTEVFAPQEGVGLNESLKMCPACCSGPISNAHCSDLRAHHGQCPRCLSRVSESSIVSAIAQAGVGAVIGDRIPRCSRCNIAVFFNGCLDCGHLFADLRWDELPAWDARAKDRLEASQRHRRAAWLLATRVREEAALLAHERAPLGAQSRGACSAGCRRVHRGKCLECDQDWTEHMASHRCFDGRRVSWTPEPSPERQAR